MDKQFDPRGLEEKWYQRWEAAGLFKPESHGEGDPFVITLPPPNVTGVLHIGHCLGNSVQDCLIRHYRMRGRPALWIPGTDHASIATENKVAEELAREGLSKEGLGRQAFLERAWDWARRHHDHIVLQLKRFGGSLDWDREAFTLDEARNRAVTEAFVRLYEKGLIYRGDYMVNWSVAQRSAVSDEEVEYREVAGKLWHFRYPLKGGGYLTIATTRPETMLGDTAVAIHPHDEKTAQWKGRTVILPLVGREIPIIEDEYVDPEFGSGCVKITPSHDPNDYEIGKRHGLPFVNILNPDGTLNDQVPEKYRGLDRFEARERIVRDLEELGLVDRIEDHVHSVGYHDRTGTVIEPYVSTQWFLRMDELAKPALRAVQDGEIKLFPERWVGVYYNWMTKIRDWCISRQLWWGHRIPVWYCSQDHVNVAREAPGVCAECGSKELRQDEDVLDTWFSSWLWTFSPLGWPDDAEDLRRYHPTSTLVTGHEIIFFWVARMIMASYEFLGEKPFSEVVFTGIVRDGQGRKMSKSLGNSPDPIEIIEKYGADALRFVLLMLAPTGQDINFDEQMVETGQHFCNKIWNATRLLFSHLEKAPIVFPAADAAKMSGRLGGDLSAEAPGDAERSGSAGGDERLFETLYRQTFGAESPEGERAPLRLEDRWILQEVTEAARRVTAAIESRRLNDAARGVYDFFWKEFCDWYLEAIKPRLQGASDAERRTALLVALTVHALLLRLMHPFLPNLTEELWELHPATAGFVIVAPWPEVEAPLPWTDEAEAFALVKELVGSARNLRHQLDVPPGRRGKLLLQVDGERRPVVERVKDHVATLAKMEEVVVQDPGPKPERSVGAVVLDIEVYLPIDGLIDPEKEARRLRKEVEQTEKRLQGLRSKLSNENFVKKAPAEVVERQRALAAEVEETLEKLQRQLAALE